MENLDANDNTSIHTIKKQTQFDQLHATGMYMLEHYRDGKLIGKYEYPNVVTTAGKNWMLDNILAGSAFTPALYVGLIGSASYVSAPVAADTSASHSGWAELTSYVSGTRPAASWSAATGGQKSLSPATAFVVNANCTIKGTIICTSATKGSTTDILLSAGLSSGGDAVLLSGDTVQAYYTMAL